MGSCVMQLLLMGNYAGISTLSLYVLKSLVSEICVLQSVVSKKIWNSCYPEKKCSCMYHDNVRVSQIRLDYAIIEYQRNSWTERIYNSHYGNRVPAMFTS